MRLALQEAERGRAEHNEVSSVRAWKLFLLRFHRFGRGEWLQLLAAGEEAAESSVRGSRRIRSNL